MVKEIINRGYLTHALTDGESKIYGIVKERFVTDWSKYLPLYWSEVFVDGNMYVIIRRGTLLVGKSNEELSQYHVQSKVNLNG